MRYIDAFNHFFPKRYYEALLETPAGAKDIGKRVRGIPALSDIDLRLRVVEQFPDYAQVLSHGLPPMERLWGPDKSPEMAKIANDGLAEVAAKHPKHFVGWSALLPMNAPEAAAKEAERVLKNGANAVQIATNANGVPLDEPQFWPIFEVIAKSGKPILLHPVAHPRDAGLSDREILEIRNLQRARLALRNRRDAGAAGVFRIMDTLSGSQDHRAPSRRRHSVSRRPRRATRSISWARAPRTRIMAPAQVPEEAAVRLFQGFLRRHRGRRRARRHRLRHRFLQPDHVLFASDCPFDKEKGPGYIRDTIKVLNSIEMPNGDREKICWRNAQALFGLAG